MQDNSHPYEQMLIKFAETTKISVITQSVWINLHRLIAAIDVMVLWTGFLIHAVSLLWP